MEAKPFWKSKTFWTNVVGLAAMAAPYVHPAGAILAAPEVQTQLVGVALAIANVGLRFKTRGPIKLG